jgi:valyl-tRNA synthetase
VDKSKFEIGRNFCTKIWNAARFIEMNQAEAAENPGSAAGGLTSDERHMLMACDKACAKVNDLISKYRIQDGALAVYDFFWTQICDWYVEYAKDAPDKSAAFAILRDVFWKALRLLHPYMPFVTEEVAHQLGFLKEDETILRAQFPQGYTDDEKRAWGLDDEVYDYVEAKREMITALRALRAEYKVNPATWVKVTIAAKDAAIAERLSAEVANLKAAFRAETVEVLPGASELAMPGALGRIGTVYLSLEGLVDKAAEAKRVAAELAKTQGFIKSIDAKLGNENFMANAPAAIVEGQRAKRAELVAKTAQLEKLAKLFA